MLPKLYVKGLVKIDRDVILILVSVLATATVGLIGWAIKRIIDNPTKKKLANDLLEHVYSPLMAFFEMKTRAMWSKTEFYGLLDGIYKEHNAFVTPYLKDWYKEYSREIRYSNAEDDAVIRDDDVLYVHISANYNLLRKQAGLGFDEHLVNENYKLLLNYDKKRANFIGLRYAVSAMALCLAISGLALFGVERQYSIFAITSSVAWVYSRIFYDYMRKWDD